MPSSFQADETETAKHRQNATVGHPRETFNVNSMRDARSGPPAHGLTWIDMALSHIEIMLRSY